MKLLEQERDNRVQDVARLRDQVRDLAKQATGKDPFSATAESTVVINHPLADIQNKIVAAEVEQEELKARIKAMQEMAAREIPISEATITSKIEMRPEILRIKEAIMSLQVRLHTLDTDLEARR